MITPNICILGGDMRQITVGKEFFDSGSKVTVFGFDKLKTLPFGLLHENDIKSAFKKSDFIILPLPYSRDKINISSPLSGKLIPIETVREEGRDKIFFGGMRNIGETLL